jgi:hypothetical protein
MDYLALVEDTQFPSPQQTNSFITWLADAHSWYKHLDHDGEAFYLFLDPFAGLDMKGNPLTEPNGFHYNYRTTERWRKEHGFWNYSRGNPVRINHEDEVEVPVNIANQPYCSRSISP